MQTILSLIMRVNKNVLEPYDIDEQMDPYFVIVSILSVVLVLTVFTLGFVH